jgi:hypothetical protein
MKCPTCSKPLTKIKGGYSCQSCLEANRWPSLFPYDKIKLKACVLCGDTFSEWGNNPDPVALKGQCCDNCNLTRVLPARLARIYHQ